MKKELICVAQARVIGGRKKVPHICSIALDTETGNLLRVCLPFGSTSDMPVRRWTKFYPHLERSGADTRVDSFFIDETQDIEWEHSKATPALHRHLLSLATSEDELVDNRLTIGVKKINCMKLHFNKLDDKHRRHKSVMAMNYNLWYPTKLVRVSGVDMLTTKKYNRLLLDWSFFETLRKQLKTKEEKEVEKDMRTRLESYKHPYLICGTTMQRRKNFMAISVLSSPFSYA